MATNLALDDRLIQKAKDIGKHKTRREAVTAALQEHIKKREQLRIFELVGKIDYESAYNYKRERRKKR